jgi:hypothetical protein
VVSSREWAVVAADLTTAVCRADGVEMRTNMVLRSGAGVGAGWWAAGVGVASFTPAAGRREKGVKNPGVGVKNA